MNGRKGTFQGNQGEEKEFCMFRATLIPMVLALAAAGLASAQPKRSDSVVKAEAKAAKPDHAGKQTVTVTLKIDDGWHLYANPVPKDFPGIPVTVDVDAKVKPEVKVDYPAGKEVKDAMFGNYRVYEKNSVIKVDVKRAKGDDSPLNLNIKVQTCNDRTCLAPGVIKLKVQ